MSKLLNVFVKILTSLLFATLLCQACEQGHDDHEDPECFNTAFTAVSYQELIQDLDPEFLSATIELPNEKGALGRNKDAYFHARFQFNQTRLADYAVSTQNEAALDAFVQSMEFAFAHQLSNGDFEMVVPESVQSTSGTSPFDQSDQVSATSFYGYSLGMALVALENSTWFQSLESEVRNKINALKPSIALLLNFLKSHQGILMEKDRHAPNRLLINACALYSLGSYLDDQQAKELAIAYVNAAIKQAHPDGYFIEGGGWDSSYNGVALKVGMELMTIATNEVNEMLGQHISCATRWQSSRILPTGEISSEGNTRVYPGGEDFLGSEKEIDVEKTIRALFYFGSMTDDPYFTELANKVVSFYLR